MRLTLASLALALLSGDTRDLRSDVLAWRATKGAKLAKHFESSMNLEQRSVSITVGGRELPDDRLKQFEASLSMGSTLDVEDEYVSVDDARPTELVRRFREATVSKKEHKARPGKEPSDEDEKLESPLVDHAVAFTWDPEGENYARAFREGKGEEEWLAPLEPDMDLRAILPASAVEEGETWKIEPESFRALTMPGGRLSFPITQLSFDFDKNVQGTIEARYAGKRELEGLELRVIELSVHVSLTTEKESDAGTPLHYALGMDLAGEYLWDQAQGHLHSFELSGPATMSVTGEREVEVRGQKLPMKEHFELGGEVQDEGRFE